MSDLGSTDLLLLYPELLSEHFLRLTLEQKNIPVESALNDKQKLTDIYVQHVIPLPQRSLPKSRWGKKIEEKRGKSISPTPPNKSVVDKKKKNVACTKGLCKQSVIPQNVCTQGRKSSTENLPAAQQSLRKRPLIVFDGSSTKTSIKIRKENDVAPERLKPPPSASTTNTIRRISLSPSNSSSQSSTLSPTRSTKMETSRTAAQQNKAPVTPSNNLFCSGANSLVKLKRAAPKEEQESLDDVKPTEAKKKIQHVTWP